MKKITAMQFMSFMLIALSVTCAILGFFELATYGTVSAILVKLHNNG